MFYFVTRLDLWGIVGVTTIRWLPHLSLIADNTPADLITGGAGWTATAVLVGVLGWIFYSHLPAKDKQAAEKDKQTEAMLTKMLEREDTKYKELTTQYIASTKEIRNDFRDALNTVVAHCERETALMSGTVTLMSETVEALKETLADIRDTLPKNGNDRKTST